MQIHSYGVVCVWSQGKSIHMEEVVGGVKAYNHSYGGVCGQSQGKSFHEGVVSKFNENPFIPRCMSADSNAN